MLIELPPWERQTSTRARTGKNSKACKFNEKLFHSHIFKIHSSLKIFSLSIKRNDTSFAETCMTDATAYADL